MVGRLTDAQLARYRAEGRVVQAMALVLAEVGETRCSGQGDGGEKQDLLQHWLQYINPD